jgi:hypothetical protein
MLCHTGSMNKLGIQQFAGTGKRGQPRLRVRLPARLITLNGEFRVVLCDLSTGGARVGKPGLVLDGGQAVLLWESFEAFCAVAWCRGGLVGVRFEDPIPNDWVLVTRELDSNSNLPPDAELDRRAARDWVLGQARI